MNAVRLNAEVIDLFEERRRLLAELERIEALLQKKQRVLIGTREAETAAHDVRRVAERRCACKR
jgi:hypothetical protein